MEKITEGVFMYLNTLYKGKKLSKKITMYSKFIFPFVYSARGCVACWLYLFPMVHPINSHTTGYYHIRLEIGMKNKTYPCFF